MKRFMRKAKNVVLKAITTAAAFGLFYSLMALEIEMWRPLAGIAFTAGWLIVYVYANRERFGGEA